MTKDEINELHEWLIDASGSTDSPYESQMLMKAANIVGEKFAPEPEGQHGHMSGTQPTGSLPVTASGVPIREPGVRLVPLVCTCGAENSHDMYCALAYWEARDAQNRPGSDT